MKTGRGLLAWMGWEPSRRGLQTAQRCAKTR